VPLLYSQFASISNLRLYKFAPKKSTCTHKVTFCLHIVQSTLVHVHIFQLVTTNSSLILAFVVSPARRLLFSTTKPSLLSVFVVSPARRLLFSTTNSFLLSVFVVSPARRLLFSTTKPSFLSAFVVSPAR